MASDTVLNSENYTEDKKVLIEICEDLDKLLTDDPNCDGVYVCHVPISLSSVNPEAFIPHYVGLGPYHHFRNDLIMTRELKLGVAKRVLNLTYNNKAMFHQQLQNIVIDSHLLYHADVHSKYDHHTLLQVLIVDGLFLLALLHSRTVIKTLEGPHTYFLTGKPGMPLVNSAGLDLNMLGVIKDLFMIENQIPTYVLKHINKVIITTSTTGKEIQFSKDLGSAMQVFCEAHCPLIPLKKLAKVPQDHHHLLDLMYHLVAETDPDPDPEPEPQPQPQPQPHEPDNFDIPRQIIVYLLLSFWMAGLVVVYFIRLILQLIIWLLRFLLRKVIPSMQAPQPTKFPSLLSTLRSAIDMIHGYLSLIDAKWLKPYTQILSRINERTRAKSTDSTSSGEIVIPSATELSKNVIIFKLAEGGSITSIKFDEIHRRFYLPCIELDLTSGVIIRNLLVYESLTKPQHFIFARFIKLMSNLIVTAEDVKLLVDKKIIKTKLSDGTIAQFFNGIGKLVNAGPTKIQKLEREIKKVKDKFDGMQNVRKMFREFFIPIIVFSVSFFVLWMVASPLLSLYCYFYPSSWICKPPQLRDYASQR